jgi:hypothetical protein
MELDKSVDLKWSTGQERELQPRGTDEDPKLNITTILFAGDQVLLADEGIRKG